MFKNIE